jgi:hypothetical protein
VGGVLEYRPALQNRQIHEFKPLESLSQGWLQSTATFFLKPKSSVVDKRIVIDLSVPLAGIAAAESSLNQTASNIAHATTAQSGASGGGDTVDLSADAVALIEARNSVAANVNVVRAEDQMTATLLNLVS